MRYWLKYFVSSKIIKSEVLSILLIVVLFVSYNKV